MAYYARSASFGGALRETGTTLISGLIGWIDLDMDGESNCRRRYGRALVMMKKQE